MLKLHILVCKVLGFSIQSDSVRFSIVVWNVFGFLLRNLVNFNLKANSNLKILTKTYNDTQQCSLENFKFLTKTFGQV